MTTPFFIQSDTTPLAVSIPMLATMSPAEFCEFCQANRELRIERTATGDVIVNPPAYSFQVIPMTIEV
jgi:hypothetical protein